MLKSAISNIPIINKHYLIVILLGLILCSCNKTNNKDKNPVARVNDKYLYQTDLKNIVPEKTPQEDSINIIKDYIEKWVKRQVIISKAELNLTAEQKDVNELIEKYRAALLIYKYQQEYLNQKIDTNLTDEDIEKYFAEHTSEFKLENNIVKALYLKIPLSAPKINYVKKWYTSENEKDIQSLTDYCSQFANKYDEFNDSWINFTELLINLPINIDQNIFLKTNKTIETKDSLFYYFVNIRAIKFIQEVAPFEYVKSRISKIIINKRKLELLKNLEQDLYQDAITNKEVEIYN